MAAAQLTPFKAKVDERTARVQAEQKTESPPKKQCNPYEKQLQSMEGDTGLVKDRGDRFNHTMDRNFRGYQIQQDFTYLHHSQGFFRLKSVAQCSI